MPKRQPVRIIDQFRPAGVRNTVHVASGLGSWQPGDIDSPPLGEPDENPNPEGANWPSTDGTFAPPEVSSESPFVYGEAGLELTLAANSGLAVTAAELHAVPVSPLTRTASGIELTLASPSGLGVSGGALSVLDSLAGAGLTMTGKVLAIGAGTLITVNADDVALAAAGGTYQFIRSAGTTTPAWGAISDLAGAGLTAASGVLAVGAGTLITVGATTVGLSAAGGNYQMVASGGSTTPTWTNISTLAGSGLSHSAGVLSVGTPTTLTAATTNSASGTTHSHAVTATADGHTNVNTLLKSGAAGDLKVTSLAANTIAQASGTTVTLQPSGNLLLSPGGNQVQATSGVALQSDNYASQLTGWRVDYAGGADFRYLFVDELHAKSFIVDLEQALAGGQIISKSVAMVATDFTLPAAGSSTSFRVRDLPSAPNMAVFQSGDMVRFRQFSRAAGSLTIADAWGTVSGYGDGSGANEGTQTWSFTRSSGGNAGTATGTIAADSLVLDYGTTGNGYYEVNAIDGAYASNSPYSQTVRWTTHPVTGSVVTTRQGNLYGLFAQAGEVGLYAGNGVSITDSYLRISSYAAELHNLPMKLYNGSTQTVDIQADGDAKFGADVGVVGSTVLQVFATAQTYDSESMGAGDIVIGDHAAGHMLWDESAGQLKFRDGTTVQAYVGTNGKVFFGGGKGIVAADGLALEAQTAGAAATSVCWYKTPDTLTDLVAQIVGYQAASKNQLAIWSHNVNSLPGFIELQASGSSDSARVQLLGAQSGRSSVAMEADDLVLVGLVKTSEIRAYDAGGLSIADDGGNLGVFVADGGAVGVKTTSLESGYELTVGGEVAIVAGFSNPALKLSVGSTPRVGLMSNHDASGYSADYAITALTRDNGSGIGPCIAIGRNSNASTPAPGTLCFVDMNGTQPRALWVDTTNVWRTGTRPSGGTDTGGTVIGSQTSAEEFKRVLGPGWGGEQALTALRELVASDPFRRFVYTSGAYNGQEFDGLVLSRNNLATWRYGMDRNEEFPHGRALNEIVALADIMRALVHVAERVERMEQRWH